MIDLQLLGQDYQELEYIRIDLESTAKSFKEEPFHYTEHDSIVEALKNVINIIKEKQYKIENYIHENKDT